MADDPNRLDAAAPTALPAGTRLGEFELKRVLGIGGFGIVYLAFDHALEREVAVKEYMPSSLAGRTSSMHVSLRSQGDAETFALGLKSFVNEARLLARFDHPSLLKVHRFWEANNTAYMAMPVYRGRTLKEERAAMAAPPDEAWLRRLLDPLLGAIATLHAEGVFHRDIAPDNIVLEPDGHPVLLDFGAARRVVSEKSQTLTAILKPAYAPIEQYADSGSVRQGPWTDLYALGATLHFLLLGKPPVPATTRTIHDDLVPLARQSLAGCSPEFLRIVDWMLAPRPADRPQDVAQLRAVLEGRAPVPGGAPAEPPPAAWERTQNLDATVVVPRTGAPKATVPPQVQPPPSPPPPMPPPPAPRPPAPAPKPAAPPPAAMATAPSGGSSKLPLVVGAVLLIGAVGGYLFWPKPAAAPAVTAAAPVVVPSPLPSPSPTPSPAAAAPVETPAASMPAPPPAAPPVARTEAPPAPKPVERKPVASPRPAHNTAPSPSPMPSPTPAPSPPAESPKPQPTAPSPTPVAESPAPEATPQRVAGPRERCGKRVAVSLLICMEKECGKPELRQHPECVRWRADQERKANPMAN